MKFYIEHSITLYHAEVFEADSLEEARLIRDSTTYEYYDHLAEKMARMPTALELHDNVDYVDIGELDWPWYGPVMSKEEFISKYTSLEA